MDCEAEALSLSGEGGANQFAGMISRTAAEGLSNDVIGELVGACLAPAEALDVAVGVDVVGAGFVAVVFDPAFVGVFACAPANAKGAKSASTSGRIDIPEYAPFAPYSRDPLTVRSSAPSHTLTHPQPCRVFPCAPATS